MNVHEKIDQLLGNLHVLAAAPDAADAGSYQETMRTVLADLPEQSEPAGLDQHPDTDAHRLKTTDANQPGLARTDGYAHTQWPFVPIAPDEAITGASRIHADSPGFVDHVPRTVTACPAVSAQSPCDGCYYFVSGVNILEGGILCDLVFTAFGFCPPGSFQWYDLTGSL